ncbi:hypothetical protein JG688_00013054 [Phytophthora aleatoria]|uniref:Uncharacterized protein n=1 Tax=Phytophthora aleatoria TaxID=2496075 RepID=A0A8J5IMJ4_9STRA|nr:hypothetical protein JG688_00013054 [Phytophthora aleatoria]
MHVKEHAVFRFVEELGWVNWSHQNQVFLDEVTFDNRGMIQKRVYAMRGEKVAIRAYCPFFNPIEFTFGYMKKLSSATTTSRVRGISHHLSWKRFSSSSRLIWHVCLSIAGGRCKATLILLVRSRRKRERCQTFGKTREEFAKVIKI